MIDRSTPPATGAPPALEPPVVHRARLDNGLGVIVTERRRLPIVDLRLVVRTGAGADPPAVAGRASLTAEMLDEGTASFGALELAEAVDSLGADLDVDADWDSSIVSLHVLADRLDEAVDLLADVVARPAFREDDFDRVRERRLADLVRRRQEPRHLAADAFVAAVYGPEHPYGAPLTGTAASIASLDRDALVEFHREHYHPANAFLVAAGAVEAGALVARLERAFRDWKPRAGTGPEPPGPPEPGPAEPRPSAVHLIDRPGAPQSEVRIGHAGPPRAALDEFPLRVMNTVLGGAFTARLNRILREERGYTYGAGTRIELRTGPGPFCAATAVFTEGTADTLAVIVREIERLREEPVPGEELERARSYVSYGLPRRLETSADLARALAEVERYDLGGDHLQRYVERVQRVTAEDVLRTARAYLRPDRLALVVVGDRSRIEASIREAGFDALRIAG